MRLVNIINFEIDYSFDDLKRLLEKDNNWRLSAYKPEEQYQLVAADNKTIDAKRGSIEGQYYAAEIIFEIDDISVDRKLLKLRASMTYPDAVQNLYRARNSNWKMAVSSFDSRLSNLLRSLNARVLED